MIQKVNIMNFKKLTYPSGGILYVNLDNATVIRFNPEKKSTIIHFDGEEEVIVKETPAQIFNSPTITRIQ